MKKDLIHLIINSLFPKINELQYAANSSNAAVIGIHESKLGESVLQSKVQINNYDQLRRDRNKNGEGVTSYIRSDMRYIQMQFFSDKIENTFFEILLPKTKPVMVGIIYRSPTQNNVLKILSKNFPSIGTDSKETNVLVII